jgi:hypothetical protein
MSHGDVGPQPVEVGYRIYLRAELGKLRNLGDARQFLAKRRCPLDAFGLPETDMELIAKLEGQAAVDAFVDGLDLAAKRAMAQCCENWRGNSIARKLLGASSVSLRSVPVERLVVAAAESGYEYLFARNHWSLARVAADPELRRLKPYADFTPGILVAEPRCIAEPARPGAGSYRIIDGIHRAIHLVWSSRESIDLCILNP